MKSIRDYSQQIIDLQRQRAYREAYELMSEALTVYPTHPFLLKTEVFLLSRLKKIKEARLKAESRLESFKSDVFFLKTYLGVLIEAKAKQDLDKLIEAILAWGVGNQDFLVYLADTATRFLSAEKGENVLRQAAARYPESELLQKAASAEEINREGAGGVNKYRERFAHHAPQEAAAEIEAVLVMPVYANDSELLLYLAELYKKLEKYDKAADIYSRLLALKNSEYIRKMLGYALYRSGDRQQAASYLKSVLMEKPDDPFLSSTLFKIYKEKADIEGLEKLVSEVLAVKPEAKHLYGLLRKAQKWQKNSPT